MALLLVLLELPQAEHNDPHSQVLYGGLGLATATAVGLSRRCPGGGLALAWAVLTVQAVTGVDLLLSEAAFGVLAFGAARWGSLVTVWASGLSIPVATSITFWLVRSGALGVANIRDVVGSADRLGTSWQPVAIVAGAALLGTPWFAGLSLRLGAQARTSNARQVRAEQAGADAVRIAEHAQELALLRDGQTRLARDVHDVVGHSLTVILVQAESAQYLDGADTGAVHQALENIAGSARSSLKQIRQVLSSLDEEQAGSQTGGLGSLIEGVRGSGRQVVTTLRGEPRPLAPTLDLAAFRVLQEMLTNALKHGSGDQPIHVDQRWSDQLSIEVRNAVEGDADPAGGDPEPGDPDTPGQQHGMEGMRRRLESVGGQLDVQRGSAPAGSTFTVTAWLPLTNGAG